MGDIFTNNFAPLALGIPLANWLNPHWRCLASARSEGLIPGFGKLVSVGNLFSFPLRGERLIELKQKIMDVHSEKKTNFTKSKPAGK
jgi:hypothetical protein